MTGFEFATAARVVFGAGAARGAAGHVLGLGGRPLVVTGGTPDRVAWLAEALEAGGAEYRLLSVEGEPELDFVTRSAEYARTRRFDVVVAVGGGSALDAGKAIAALATNPGDPLEYLEGVGRGQPLRAAPLPLVAVPTTAGTGSEVTRNAVLTVPARRAKVSLRSPLMLPRVAIVDPELTYDLPPALTASTGLDALTQLVEPFLSSRATPITDALARAGIPLVARSLRRAVADGRDAGAREDMALASLFGGMALANAGLGAVHGLAGPIGGMFPAAHGAVCAALLPHVVGANVEALRAEDPGHPALVRIAEVAGLLTGRGDAPPEASVGALRQLVADVGIPGLASSGVTDASIDAIATQAAGTSSMKGNPVALDQAALSRIVRAAL